MKSAANEAKTWQVRGVLGAAYVDLKRGILTHAVGLDDDGCEIAVACGKVKLENIADQFALEGKDTLEPTCKACLKKWLKLTQSS